MYKNADLVSAFFVYGYSVRIKPPEKRIQMMMYCKTKRQNNGTVDMYLIQMSRKYAMFVMNSVSGNPYSWSVRRTHGLRRESWKRTA